MSPDTVPEHVTPHNLLDISNDEIDVMLEGIRKRRMESRIVYDAAMATRREKESARAAAALEKKLAIFHKELEQIDRKFEKLEKRANEIRALRLQVELDI